MASSHADAAWSGFHWPKKDPDGRTHQPVRRKSRRSLGAAEPSNRMTQRQRESYLRAFDRMARNARPEKVRRGHAGTYSWFSHQVLDYLMGWAVTTGRVYPSIAQISATLGLGVKEVVKALAQLRAGGWVSWERRLRPSGLGAGEAGPQIEQDTNLYRIHLPTAAGELLAGWRAAAQRKAGLTPVERERRDRADRVGAERRDCEGKLRTLEQLLRAATRETDRRRIAKLIAATKAQAESAAGREAKLRGERDFREGRE